MTTFAATAQPPVAPLDPSKHVKYTLGMVLGVEDFDQEFAYLSARDRWLARDLSGYGTVWGLKVTVESGGEPGPRVNVAPGAAVTPCGRFVCVEPAQCASLNEWLAANEEEVRARFGPPPGPARLYVVLCHRECPTDNLPIPGEPCRTEDRLTAPSRLKDDFRLELRMEPPGQREEDALRDLVAWLRAIPVVDGPPVDLEPALEELRLAAQVALDTIGSPPHSPPEVYDFVLGAPPPGLTISASQTDEFLRAALALWVTEFRGAFRRGGEGCECGCAGSGSGGCGCGAASGLPEQDCDDDVVLLAALDLDLVPSATDETVVADAGWEVDASRRPILLHARLVQEWLLTGGFGTEPGAPPGMPFIVAGGQFGPRGGARWSYRGLFATKLAESNFYHLWFPGFDERLTYVVKGTAFSSSDELHFTLERIAATDQRLIDLLPNVLDEVGRRPKPTATNGLWVRVAAAEAEKAPDSFEVEVSTFPAVAINPRVRDDDR